MKFYESVRSDPELEALATNALKDGPGALVVLGLLRGFEFTEEELVAALSERRGWLDGELSDTDLDIVAGGTASEVARPSLKDGTPRFG
jgi:predicted ribosomally synthesized peptide with nif11-like leader